MPTDPGLADNQISVHDGPVSQPWMSDDIWLNRGTPDNDRAQPAPSTNAVEVTVRFNPGATQPLPPGTALVFVDVYIGNPSLAMTPLANTTRITNVPTRPDLTIDLTDFTAANSYTVRRGVTWTLPSPAPAPPDPQSPGHRCLLVRVYGDTQTPSPGNFFPITDEPHVAQRNICIVTCSSPCSQAIETALPEEAELFAERTFIQAFVDLKPSRWLMKQLLPTLEATPGFKRFATAAPPPFKLDFKDVEVKRFFDYTEKRNQRGFFGRRRFPNLTAEIALRPGQLTTFDFLTDLENVEFGDAYIVHLTHIGQNEKERFLRGGLTLVTLRVPR